MEEPRTTVQTVRGTGITRNTSIDEVGLSGRARNTLSRRGIETVGDLEALLANPEEILTWTGVGRSVYDEIMSLSPAVEKLRQEMERLKAQGSGTWKKVIIDRSVLRERGELRIPEGMFNSRVMARVERAGFNDITRFQGLTIRELMGQTGLDVRNAERLVHELRTPSILTNLSTLEASDSSTYGYILTADEEGQYRMYKAFLKVMPYMSIRETLDMPEEMAAEMLPAMVFYFDGPEMRQFREAVGQITTTFAFLGIYLREEMETGLMGRMLAEPALRSPDTSEEERRQVLGEIFFSGSVVQAAVAARIRTDLRLRKNGWQQEALQAQYPALLQGKRFEEAVEQLVRTGECVRLGSFLCAGGIPIREWVREFPNPNKRKIIEMRLMGGTLDEIGQEVGLTRERVRQIVDAALNSQNFQEDRYAGLFETYNFDPEQARMAFGIMEGNYLSLVFERGERDLEDALEDEQLPDGLRLHIEAALERDYILDRGNLVRRQANEVKNYLIRVYCQEQTSVADYIRIYREFCRKHDPDKALRQLDEQSISNKLHDSMMTVTTYGKKFRYYPIASTDMTDLVEGLHLRDYTDVEYSALYFYRAYPELMEQYDIRDACELHNLLKKTVTEEMVPGLVFGRMPILKFGNCDRSAQVEGMLRDCAPQVSNQELARLYEERYGVASATFIANYCGCIAQYFFGGMYKLDAELLPEEQAEYMRGILTREFYLTEDFRRIYMEAYPGATGAEIVPITIRQLGFKPYQGYVVSAKYHSATDYIEHLLLDQEETDMALFPPKLTIQHLFSRIYMLYKQQYEILEVSPGKLLRLSVFEKKGVHKEDFERYVNRVIDFPMEEEFFSIHSLREAGFRDPLDRLRMSDWFYATLLQQRMEAFSLQRIGGVKILRRGRRPFNASTVIEQVVREHGPMSMDEMLTYLQEKHGVEIDKKRLFLLIGGGNLFYDRLTRKIYVSGEELEQMMEDRQRRFSAGEETENETLN